MRFIGPGVALILGSGLGVLIWMLSPLLAGHVEPWDGQEHYYPVALFVSGALASLSSPRSFVWAAVGVFLGQSAWLLHLLSGEPSAFGPLGLIFVAAYSAVALAGGFCVWKIFGRNQGGGDSK